MAVENALLHTHQALSTRTRHFGTRTQHPALSTQHPK